MKFTYEEIEEAFFFVSAAPYGEHFALLRKDTGEILMRSEMTDMDEISDEDWGSEHSVAIPHRNDLRLGKRLVFDFVLSHLPDELDRVEDMFRGPGAYGRYKNFLNAKGLLEQWYDFENKRQEETLRQWCSDEGIELSD